VVGLVAVHQGKEELVVVGLVMVDLIMVGSVNVSWAGLIKLGQVREGLVRFTELGMAVVLWKDLEARGGITLVFRYERPI